MQVVELAVSGLKHYENNARTHSEKQVEEIAASIKRFGFNNPIVIDGENVVRAGNGRLMAAKILGLEKVPTISIAHLTKEELKAYVLADNQIALNSGWDYELLESELNDISSNDEGLVDLLGFSDDYLNSILDRAPGDNGKEEKKTKTVEGAKEYSEEDFTSFDNTCPKCGFEYDN